MAVQRPAASGYSTVHSIGLPCAELSRGIPLPRASIRLERPHILVAAQRPAPYLEGARNFAPAPQRGPWPGPLDTTRMPACASACAATARKNLAAMRIFGLTGPARLGITYVNLAQHKMWCSACAGALDLVEDPWRTS